MRIKMSLIAHMRDNGDGSSSAWLYNNKEELNVALAENSYDDELLTYDMIAAEDNPYENGYVTDVEFEIDVDVDVNTAKLVTPAWWSVG